MTMFSSSKELLNIPVVIRPYNGIDGAGDKSFGLDVNTMCYAEDKVNVVVDSTGREVTSATTLYLDGADAVVEGDEVVYRSKTRPVKAISAFYESDGTRSILVVYL